MFDTINEYAYTKFYKLSNTKSRGAHQHEE